MTISVTRYSDGPRQWLQVSIGYATEDMTPLAAEKFIQELQKHINEARAAQRNAQSKGPFWKR